MAENADFSSLLEEIKENMPELYQEMEAYAQRTGKSLAELSKDEAFVSRYSARYSERKDAVTALDNAVDEEIAGAGSKKTAPWPMTTSLPRQRRSGRFFGNVGCRFRSFPLGRVLRSRTGSRSRPFRQSLRSAERRRRKSLSGKSLPGRAAPLNLTIPKTSRLKKR